MAQIIKGDQYSLPIKIMSNNTVVTPSDCNDVRIQIGNYLKEYSKSELTFNSTTNEWQFPMTEQMSRSFDGVLATVQVGVKVTSEFIYSLPTDINVGENIIKKEW